MKDTTQKQQSIVFTSADMDALYECWRSLEILNEAGQRMAKGAGEPAREPLAYFIKIVCDRFGDAMEALQERFTEGEKGGPA